MDPDFWLARYFRGLIYEQEGLFAQAIRELRCAEELSEGNALPIAGLAHCHAGAGFPWDARRILQNLEQESTRYVSPWALGLVYAGLGENERALDLLTQSIADGSAQLVLFSEPGTEARFPAFRAPISGRWSAMYTAPHPDLQT